MSFRRLVLRNLEKQGEVHCVSIIAKRIGKIKKFISKYPNANIDIITLTDEPKSFRFKATAWISPYQKGGV